MELFIFARFHAREGQETAVAAALREVVAPSRQEPGCVAVGAYRSTREPRLPSCRIPSASSSGYSP